jgi:hypothetical protein
MDGVAMSSSPWQRLGNGDEDVASPFPVRAMWKAMGSRL